MLLLSLTLTLGDLQWSEVSPFAGSSYPEYLELSRGPPSVGSISVSQEHEQLSKVPPVVESTSQGAPPVVQSIFSCGKSFLSDRERQK